MAPSGGVDAVADSLPSLRTPPCRKLGGDYGKYRVGQHTAAPPPAPPGAPPSAGSGKLVESSIRRSPLLNESGPASPRHFGPGSHIPLDADPLSPNHYGDAAAYPQAGNAARAVPVAANSGLTPRPPSDQAPKGAVKRPNATGALGSSRRIPSQDASIAASGGSRAQQTAPLTARESSSRRHREVQDKESARSQSPRGAQRGSSRSRNEKKPPGSSESNRSTSHRRSQQCSGQPPPTPRGQVTSRGAGPASCGVVVAGAGHRAASPRNRPASSSTSQYSLSERGSPEMIDTKELAIALSTPVPAVESGSSSSFQNIMQEMSKDRELWDSKVLRLVSSSRPGTAEGPRPTSSSSRPSSSVDESRSGDDSRAVGAAAELLILAEEAMAEEKSEMKDQDAGSGDVSTDAGSGDMGADVLELDPGESLIAVALRSAGIDPETADVSDLMIEGEEPAESIAFGMPSLPEHIPSASSTRSGDSSKWAASAKSWAAARVRRKKEISEQKSRSNTGTPTSCTAGRASPSALNC
eukprot:TRINITY_DN5562_c2_g2_i1.p1 TRINITY_DN5562_c2_g2~~TRINITY_DN5562_c2_g2_i1.p1  ORF type:complete len:525 (-),score=96.11 TRINITY_DN5562_c2_g2_i1:153-1727(-)